jgi:hypothetical protein
VGVIVPSGFQISPQDQGGNDATDSDINPANSMTGPVNLAAGENNTTVDAGLNQPPVITGSIGDFVWNDTDRDGVQDLGEPGIPNVTVMLQDCSGNTLATTTTDANGLYRFSNRNAGCYVVMFNPPSGFVISPRDQGSDLADSDPDQSTGKTGLINLAQGENNSTIDAGLNQPAASLGDKVFNDLDRDGVQDANEPGIPNVTVQLKDCSNNVLRTTTTDANGIYAFTNLNPGCYTVGVVVPSGFQISPQDQGGNDATDSDINPANSMTGPVNLAAGQNNITVDAGLNQPPASLGDKVFNDLDGDGVQDANEPGIPGVTVMLQDCNGNTLATTTTNASGLYAFNNLAPGCYVVMFNAPANFAFSPQDQGGNDATDSDANPTTGKTGQINLVAGQNNPTVDAGLRENICLVIIDEDGIDNDMRTIEQAAFSHGVTPDYLINDDRPTKVGNPWFRWNEQFAGDIVKLPTGQVDDEGWFAMPPTIRYADDRGTSLTYDQWIAAFVAGTLSQELYDKVRDVQPLWNQELVKLVGRKCVAIVWDSDISMNTQPLYGNLQGERYGKFAFTVLAVEVPGSIPESGSSSSLYDLWVRVEPPIEPTFPYTVEIHDHEPDSIQTNVTNYSGGVLTVEGTSQFADSRMTVSVDGADAGADRNVAPFVLEAVMTPIGGGRWRYTLNTPVNLDGRRVVIQTNHGGAYNDYIR